MQYSHEAITHFTCQLFLLACMWEHFCISQMGIQIFFQILYPKTSTLVICVPKFFMIHVKRVPKIIRHFVHVGLLLYLQNGYPNMFSNFKSEKFIPCYVCSFILTRSSENSPQNDSPLRPCGINFATQNLVSKYALRFWIWKIHPS